VFTLDKAHIKHSMMIRTKHNHIFNAFCSTLLNRFNVANIVSGLLPTAYNTFIFSQKECKAVSHGLDTLPPRNHSSSCQISRVPNARASQRTKSCSSPTRAIVLKSFSTNLTESDLFKLWDFLKFSPSVFYPTFSRTCLCVARKFRPKLFPANGASLINSFKLCSLRCLKGAVKRTITPFVAIFYLKCFSTFLTSKGMSPCHIVHVSMIPYLNIRR